MEGILEYKFFKPKTKELIEERYKHLNSGLNIDKEAQNNLDKLWEDERYLIDLDLIIDFHLIH